MSLITLRIKICEIKQIFIKWTENIGRDNCQEISKLVSDTKNKSLGNLSNMNTLVSVL